MIPKAISGSKIWNNDKSLKKKYYSKEDIVDWLGEKKAVCEDHYATYEASLYENLLDELGEERK